MDTESRISGSILGSAVGDALGTTLEFMKGGFAPLTGMKDKEREEGRGDKLKLIIRHYWWWKV